LSVTDRQTDSRRTDGITAAHIPILLFQATQRHAVKTGQF